MNNQPSSTVACIGMGVIGCGWAAHFLGQGYGVQAWDPAPGGEQRLQEVLDLAWPAMEQMVEREPPRRT